MCHHRSHLLTNPFAKTIPVVKPNTSGAGRTFFCSLWAGVEWRSNARHVVGTAISPIMQSLVLAFSFLSGASSPKVVIPKLEWVSKSAGGLVKLPC